jgi:predicted O-linked N-acetylglucosamine transferase (SPINDLY family)
MMAKGRSSRPDRAHPPTVSPTPAPVAVHSLLQRAVAHHRRGELAQAEALYRAILARAPRQFDATHLLGVVHQQRGEKQAAVDLLGKATRLDPNHAAAHSNLGVALRDLGQLEDALQAFDRAISLEPKYPEALNNRGGVLAQLHRHGVALASFDRALALRPDYPEALSNRANALLHVGRHREALASCERALALRPDYAEALNNRGRALLELGRHDEALDAFDRALGVEPGHPEALSNRGSALLRIHRYDDAASCFLRLIRSEPDFPYGLGNLLASRLYSCDWEQFAQVVEVLRRRTRENRTAADPFTFLAVSDSTDEQLRCARSHVAARYPPAAKSLWTGEQYRHDRIRIAYLSADFREHAVAYLMGGVFEQHDRARFDVTAVSFGANARDSMRNRLERAFERFIDARDKSDVDVALLLRELEIDVAIDLNGFTSGARTGVLAMRPAPVQVNYLGYPGTSGARYIDYILADRFVIPEAQQANYSEKVVYLPDSFQANDSQRWMATMPSRAQAHLPEQGFVFCSFNNSYKITPTLFEVWMRLLRQVEGSVLWLLAGNASAALNLRREAGARGVDPSRLILAPLLPYPEHLARLGLGDLFLDTLPYNAGTTASDALWAGLPVLTCAGEAFASRMAGSLVAAVGLPELIVGSLGEYESLAVALATDPDRLAGLRNKLSGNRESTPVFDTDRFRRHLEMAYVEMQQRTRLGKPPVGFSIQPVP